MPASVARPTQPMNEAGQPITTRDVKKKISLAKLKLDNSGDASRLPPSFLPPGIPLPSPVISQADMLTRLQHTPVQSPVASPFRTAPLKLIEALVTEEKNYLEELNILQTIIKEQLLGPELDSYAKPVECLITLSSELSSTLVQKESYFSDVKRECLLHFAQVASTAYQSYFAAFALGTSLGISQSAERVRLLSLLQKLNRPGDPDRDLDWLLRRPLSRVRAYSTAYKKLLHSSEDATDMFLAYENFHGLLIEARETLDAAREEQGHIVNIHSSRSGHRSISGGSTSTQSSSNSKISASDELFGLQNSLDTSQCKDIFSLTKTTCTLQIAHKEGYEQSRAIVNRDNFQLHIKSDIAERDINSLVELVLLTDQILIIQPGLERPLLLFAPLLRGVFHVSCVPSQELIFELDIVGRQTLRFTASSSDMRAHWYNLLLACEDFKLDAMPAVPKTLIEHVGRTQQQPWMPLAPARPPPIPPHSASTPTFGMTAPLRVIRENSQLSIGPYSDASGRTPEAKDHPPFQFDHEDDTTPRAIATSNPFEKGPVPPLRENNQAINRQATPQTIAKPQSTMNTSRSSESFGFPQPPERLVPTKVEDNNVDLFSPHSYTEQFLRGPATDHKRDRMTPEASEDPEPPLKDIDLDFTKDQEFDASLLDLPTLPAFDFGDGVRRPSSIALNFSPNTMTNFGIPVRKVRTPAPMVIPEIPPSDVSPPQPQSSGTLAQKELGDALKLQTSPTTTPVKAEVSTETRDVVFATMAECFSWVNATWTPILMDDVDDGGKLKTVRSSEVSVFFDQHKQGSLQIFDKKDGKALHVFGIYSTTSIIRDDPCDISVGFDVGEDKYYYMFRAENPDKANSLQDAINRAKFTAPKTSSIATGLPTTPLWSEVDSSAAIVESLKFKLHIFDTGKWINKGNARLTIRMIAQSSNRRITITGKTKKNERIMLVDYIASPGDSEALSKSSVSLKTKTDTFKLEFKGGEKERTKILSILND